MLTYTTLASGSSGNCALVSCGRTHLLLDAGISARRITTAVKNLGVDPAALSGVLVTHEHSDHISGLTTLTKQLGLPVYRGYKNRGFSQNDAGVLTLLHILAGTQDTNVIARSDYDTMLEVRRRVRRLLDSGLENRDYLREIRQLDREFSAAGISPGGSADMLALTYFVDSLESLTQNEPFPSSDAS